MPVLRRCPNGFPSDMTKEMMNGQKGGGGSAINMAVCPGSTISECIIYVYIYILYRWTSTSWALVLEDRRAGSGKGSIEIENA